MNIDNVISVLDRATDSAADMAKAGSAMGLPIDNVAKALQFAALAVDMAATLRDRIGDAGYVTRDPAEARKRLDRIQATNDILAKAIIDS